MFHHDTPKYNSPYERVTIITWDGSKSQQVGTMELFSKLRTQMKYTRTYFACIGIGQKDAHIYDFYTRELVQTITITGDENSLIKRLCFINNNKQIVVATQYYVSVWDMATRSYVHMLEQNSSDVYMILGMGEYIIFDKDKSLLSWNTRTNTVETVGVQTELYDLLAINTHRFVSCHDKGEVSVWQAHPLQKLYTMETGYGNAAYAIDWWAHNQVLCSYVGMVQIWDIISKECVESVSIDGNEIYYIKKWRNGAVLYIGGAERIMKLPWDTKKPQECNATANVMAYRSFTIKDDVLLSADATDITFVDLSTEKVVATVPGSFHAGGDVVV